MGYTKKEHRVDKLEMMEKVKKKQKVMRPPEIESGAPVHPS